MTKIRSEEEKINALLKLKIDKLEVQSEIQSKLLNELLNKMNSHVKKKNVENISSISIESPIQIKKQFHSETEQSDIVLSVNLEKFTVEELVKFELTKVQENFKIIKIKADGNCFYRALSLFFNKTDDDHMRFRHEIVNFCLLHLEIFDILERTKAELIIEINSHRIDGFFAESFQIEAAVEKFNIGILIWTDLRKECYFYLPKFSQTKIDISIIPLVLIHNHFELVELIQKNGFSVVETLPFEERGLGNIGMHYLPRTHKKEIQYLEIKNYLKTKDTGTPDIPKTIIQGK